MRAQQRQQTFDGDTLGLSVPGATAARASLVAGGPSMASMVRRSTSLLRAQSLLEHGFKGGRKGSFFCPEDKNAQRPVWLGRVSESTCSSEHACLTCSTWPFWLIVMRHRLTPHELLVSMYLFPASCHLTTNTFRLIFEAQQCDECSGRMARPSGGFSADSHFGEMLLAVRCLGGGGTAVLCARRAAHWHRWRAGELGERVLCPVRCHVILFVPLVSLQLHVTGEEIASEFKLRADGSRP